MDFNFTEDQRMVEDMARSFAEKEIAPFVDEDEENHHYRREVLTKMGELGLLGWSLPEELGGNGMGWMEAVIAQFEISKPCTSWRLSISGNNWGPAYTINKYGTEEQKKTYIPPLLDATSTATSSSTAELVARVSCLLGQTTFLSSILDCSKNKRKSSNLRAKLFLPTSASALFFIVFMAFQINGRPGGIQTPSPRIWSPMLYR